MAQQFMAKVTRIYVHSEGCSIRLEGKGDGYFNVSKVNPQYNSLYSLALVAAVNNYILWIRTVEEREEVSAAGANVAYMVIDW
jgi:hypothetical protein